MSWWTYVHGTVVIRPMGRTQAEKRYILDTVLEHIVVIIIKHVNQKTVLFLKTVLAKKT